MTDIAELYPPGPAVVPGDLTRPTRDYRLRVVGVLAGLLAFLALYVGLVAGSAWACYSCFSRIGSEPASRRPSYARSRERRNHDGWLVIGGLSAGLMCLFLVKGFFKRPRRDADQRLEVTEAEQPALFAFIRRLCHDTQAPFPHRVYLTHEVNAAVFYRQSVLSLVLPTPKNLLVGLGLVNRLNLSEFKAVLAHEFGHFSQSSMKLGSYVYTANGVIAEIVFGRDWLDDVIAWCRGTDIRIAVVAWAFTGVLWLVRRGLQGVFQAINFAHAALSRQMEFNADLVAASVAGSDAIVNALARLDFANVALMAAWQDVNAAADRGLFTRDLFHHQTQAAARLRQLPGNATLGELPDGDRVFSPDDSGVPAMWASHPTNHDREANAKRRFVPCPIDERSPWLLFADAPKVREQVTRLVYRLARDQADVTPEDPEQVQAFIDAEHRETTYDPAYHGLYDNRYLRPGPLDELLVEPVPADPAAARAELFGPALAEQMAAVDARRREFHQLAAVIGETQAKARDFEFRSVRHPASAAPELMGQLGKEMEADAEWLAAHDRRSFITHLAMARDLDADTADELERRYRFQFAVQDLHRELNQHQFVLQHLLGQAGGERRVGDALIQQLKAALDAAHGCLRDQLSAAAQLEVPPLQNIAPGDTLADQLLNRPVVPAPNPKGRSIDGAWVGLLLGQIGEVIERAGRIHFKNLGGILNLQETIAARWVQR